METMKINDQIRKLVKDAPISQHRMCKLAGISSASMSNFLAGRCGLSQETQDALGEVLGLKVTMDEDKLRKLAQDAPGRGRPAVKK